VLVTDAAGNVILGLTPGDFEVREDGKPVAVTGRRSTTTGATLRRRAASGVAVGEVPEDRYFVFLLQDQRRDAGDRFGILRRQLDALRQARRWVQEEMLRRLGGGRHVRRQAPAVRRLHHDRQGTRGPSRRGGARTGPELDWRVARGASDGPSLRARLRAVTSCGTGRQGSRADRSARRSAGPIAGRKNLILFSTGFGDVNSWDSTTRPALLPGDAAQPERNNVRSIPSSCRSRSQAPAGRFAQSPGWETGGRFLYNFVSFSRLAADLQENNGYYLLSFHSESGAEPGAYRRVTVKARNPEFRVRTRGYRVSG